MDPIGGLQSALADRYVVERKIGSGGMAVTPDGERFLMTKLPGEQHRPRIVIVLNWFDELRAKVPR